jgi:hypothetical protein
MTTPAANPRECAGATSKPSANTGTSAPASGVAYAPGNLEYSNGRSETLNARPSRTLAQYRRASAAPTLPDGRSRAEPGEMRRGGVHYAAASSALSSSW